MAGMGLCGVVSGGKPTVAATVVMVEFGVVEKVAIFHFWKRSGEGLTSAQNGELTVTGPSARSWIKHGFFNRLTHSTTHESTWLNGEFARRFKTSVSPARESGKISWGGEETAHPVNEQDKLFMFN